MEWIKEVVRRQEIIFKVVFWFRVNLGNLLEGPSEVRSESIVDDAFRQRLHFSNSQKKGFFLQTNLWLLHLIEIGPICPSLCLEFVMNCMSEWQWQIFFHITRSMTLRWHCSLTFWDGIGSNLNQWTLQR